MTEAGTTGMQCVEGVNTRHEGVEGAMRYRQLGQLLLVGVHIDVTGME